MAEEKETIVLDFKIEQGDAISEMERTKKAIIDLKDQQKQLSDEYKKGLISVDSYAKQSVNLDNQLKKNTSTYSTLQKQVTGIKSPFDKLTNSIENQTKELRVGGVSISDFGAKITALANPVTATVGIFTALAAVYERSTIGAKDLEFAQHQLGASATILSNQFAQLFSSAEDGEGIISKMVNSVLFSLSPSLAATSKILAINAEKLDDLNRERLVVEQRANELLDENATINERIADSTVSNYEKLQLTNKAIQNLRDIESERLLNSNAQLDVLKTQLSLDHDNEELQTKVLEKELEISKIKKDIEKRVSSIEKMESNIRDAQGKADQLRAESAINDELQRRIDLLGKLKPVAIDQVKIEEKELSQKNALLGVQKVVDVANSKQIRSTETLTDKQKDQALATQAISQSLNIAASQFEKNTIAYKLIASAQATIDAYRSFTLALATFPPPFGAIAGGVSLAAGLAAVAKINDVGFSEGGYTGPGGKYEAAGTVHKGEVVWNQSDVAAVGGPAMANRMRPSYADGGIVTGAMTSKINASAQSGGPVEVALVYKEYKEFMNSIKFKEQLTTA